MHHVHYFPLPGKFARFSPAVSLIKTAHRLTIVAGLCLLLTGLLLSNSLCAQSFQWVREINGGEFDYGVSTTTDNSGNVYVTGIIGLNQADVSGSRGAVYVAKYSGTGTLLWSKSMSRTGSTYSHGGAGLGIGVDYSGNVYVAGYFEGSVNFDGQTMTANGPTDIFLIKFNGSGVRQWVFKVGSTGEDRANSLALRPSPTNSSVYLTGKFTGSANFNPRGTALNLTGSGSGSTFVARYRLSDGVCIWGKALPGSGNAITIAEDDDSAVWVGGGFTDSGDFDPSSATLTLSGGGGYIGKYKTSDGSLYTAGTAFRVSSTSNGGAVTGLAVRSGTAYAVGNQSNQAFLVKATSTEIFTPTSIPGAQGRTISVGLNSSNGEDLYVGGSFRGSNVNFNGKTLSSSSLDYQDGFFARYNTSLSCQWVRAIAVTQYTQGRVQQSNEVRGIRFRSPNELITVGSYTKITNFNTCGGSSTLENSIGAGFVAKYAVLGPEVPTNLTVSGADRVCTSSSSTESYTLSLPSDLNPAPAVSWTASANLTPTSGTGTTATVRSVSGASGNGVITFNVPGACGNVPVSKNVQVGPEPININSFLVDPYIYRIKITANHPTGARLSYYLNNTLVGESFTSMDIPLPRKCDVGYNVRIEANTSMRQSH